VPVRVLLPMNVRHRHEQHVAVSEVQHLLGTRCHARRILATLHVHRSNGYAFHCCLAYVGQTAGDDVALVQSQVRVDILRLQGLGERVQGLGFMFQNFWGLRF